MNFSDLKSKLSTLETKYHKAVGREAALTDQLQTEFKCKSIAQAEKLLAKWEKENAKCSELVERWVSELETEIAEVQEELG